MRKSHSFLMKLLWVIITLAYRSYAAPIQNKYQRYLEFDAVERFREYVRIDTSQEENIKHALDFWVRQATEAGLPYALYEPAGKPIFVATFKGKYPSLPSIMLNSHIDVVQVEEKEWIYPPFEAHMDENGDIYGRGTQDAKDVAIQYMEAIRKLKQDNVTLDRTVHITLMPDEETGGKNGMKPFLQTPEFKSLHVGFVLDEGLTSADDSLLATYLDRRPWQMQFTIHGTGGHGLLMPDDSAMEKVQTLIDTVMAYRSTQKEIMKTKNKSDYSGYSSLNINVINGGLAANIIPSEIKVVIDLRLGTDVDTSEMQSLVDSWVQLTGNLTELTYIRHELEAPRTAVDDTNPYWVSMRSSLANMAINITPVVCPATSDSNEIRKLDIPAIGFSTKTNMVSRIHGKNEYHNVKTFLKGIDIYKELIKNLANLPSQ